MISERYTRPRAYDDTVYEWHLGRVPPRIQFEGKEIENPAFTHAIFVVHGMGRQRWAETAAELHSGFEDALEAIHASSGREGASAPPVEQTPPPSICEGYWGDYDNLSKTFPEEFGRLDASQREFYSSLWRKRSLSTWRTFLWFLRQQAKLVNPSVIWKVGILAWLLYIPLQVVSFAALLLMLIRFPGIMRQVLNDVRLYVSPEGIIERTIVQRIDRRVGADLLRMIGLGWSFSPLKESDKIQCNGVPVEFTRIIWVAHSLGSIISYNVLSDLLCRAAEIDRNGASSREQREGVKKFRRTLRRFVTIGSPLDKIAFLTGNEALRAFPDVMRSELLDGGETVANGGERREWWVNFYHVLDPVSGALSNRSICGNQPPLNYHIGLWKFPGLAHLSYWRDNSTLSYILSRCYGKEYLNVPGEKSFSAPVLTLIAVAGYAVWMEITLILFVGILKAVSSLAVWAGLGSAAQLIDAVARIVKLLIPFVS